MGVLRCNRLLSTSWLPKPRFVMLLLEEEMPCIYKATLENKLRPPPPLRDRIVRCCASICYANPNSGSILVDFRSGHRRLNLRGKKSATLLASGFLRMP